MSEPMRIRRHITRGTRLVALAGLAVAGIIGGGTGAGQAHAAAEPAAPWTRTLTPGLTAREVGLPASASATRLARAAIAHESKRLGLRPDARVSLDRRLAVSGAPGAVDLRFQQMAGGRRVLWSQLDVSVARDRVGLIAATVVPVDGRRPAGRAPIGRAEALEIARAAAGGAPALRPLAVAYAGAPSTDRDAAPRRARSAWVVEVQGVAPEGEDAATGLCIVVDARSGDVVARWPGLADRPDAGRNARGAQAAPSETTASRVDTRFRVMLHVYDGTGGGGIDPTNRYATFFLTGDPRTARWPAWYDTLSGLVPRTPTIDAVTANAANVARTICVVRGYCGSTGGYKDRTDDYAGTVTPWFVIGNGGVSSSSANATSLQVQISGLDAMSGTGDPNIPANDVVAHELGHVMHWTYAGDRDATLRQTLEVEEALADMFAYEYDRFDATFGEEATRGNRPPPPFRDWANPASRTLSGQPYPAHMSNYDSTPPLNAPHFNSTILSHAYYGVVARIGHPQAGRILHNVPLVLPPRPTFSQVYTAFYDRANVIYGSAVAAKVRDAFQTVGLP